MSGEEKKTSQEPGPEVEAVDPVAELESLDIQGDDFKPSQEDVKQPEKEKQEVPTSQLVLMLIGPLFKIFAPNWNIQPEEEKALSEAYGEAIDEFFPDYAPGPIEGAILVTGMVVVPRIGIPLKQPEKKAEKKEGEKNGDKSEHSSPE